jgi:hypothetical protein
LQALHEEAEVLAQPRVIFQKFESGTLAGTDIHHPGKSIQSKSASGETNLDLCQTGQAQTGAGFDETPRLAEIREPSSEYDFRAKGGNLG